MEDPPDTPSADRVVTLLEEGAFDAANGCLDAILSHSVEERKEVLRSLRAVTDDRPKLVSPLCSTLVSFLADDERSVRLSTAKLCVAIAAADPGRVEPVVDVLAQRLADDEEFYYVRARCAEALGYVALEHPEAVASPEILADFRIGLEFDEPEVREKLAKALEYVALGDPGRLSHKLSMLADHLDDDNELVRYHLTTVLVVVACERPTALDSVTDSLEARLSDENAYVRGRALEALGLVVRAIDDVSVRVDAVQELSGGDDKFVAARAQFAANDSGGEGQPPTDIGSVKAVRETTGEIVEDMTTPDTDGECPHCGLSLPENGPPMCPQCGAPR